MLESTSVLRLLPVAVHTLLEISISDLWPFVKAGTMTSFEGYDSLLVEFEKGGCSYRNAR